MVPQTQTMFVALHCIALHCIGNKNSFEYAAQPKVLLTIAQYPSSILLDSDGTLAMANTATGFGGSEWPREPYDAS